MEVCTYSPSNITLHWHWYFIAFLFSYLLAEEVEQSLEVSVDNTITDSIQMNSDSIQDEEASVHEVLDCGIFHCIGFIIDVFSPEGKCLENFKYAFIVLVDL